MRVLDFFTSLLCCLMTGKDLHAVNVEEYLNGLDGDRPKTYIESSRRLQRLPVQINGHDRRSVYQDGDYCGLNAWIQTKAHRVELILMHVNTHEARTTLPSARCSYRVARGELCLVPWSHAACAHHDVTRSTFCFAHGAWNFFVERRNEHEVVRHIHAALWSNAHGEIKERVSPWLLGAIVACFFFPFPICT